MRGNDAVLRHLQTMLGNELAASDQYFVHSRMYGDWGLRALEARVKHESDEERGHADVLIKRILFLEATPDLQARDPLHVGSDVSSMLANDLEVEYATRDMLKDAIDCCERVRDYETREQLEGLLRDTEDDHIFWLEQQLRLIELTGLANYLQAQMGEDAAGT